MGTTGLEGQRLIALAMSINLVGLSVTDNPTMHKNPDTLKGIRKEFLVASWRTNMKASCFTLLS
jgi:hypothetical protein